MSNADLPFYQKSNTLMLAVMALNLPVMLLTAAFNDTGMGVALGWSLAILAGPALSWLHSRGSVTTSVLLGMSSMFFSALMIHLGRGMIECHFHVFVFLCMLTLMAEPRAVLAAAATIAVHHISFFFLLPASVFNYDAGFGIVLMHAVFVVVETIPATYVAFRFKKLVVVQGRILGNLDGVAEDLRKVSGVTAENTVKITRSAHGQGETIRSTASAMDEISSMVEANLSAARESQKVVDDSIRAAQAGRQEIAEMAGQIRALAEQAQQTAADLNESNVQLQEITKIIASVGARTKVINEIVFKTELLSFNASVEAARAGTHGQGFAVVATEVGNLARMSGRAADEISENIEASVDKVQELVKSSAVKMQRIIAGNEERVSSVQKTSDSCLQRLEEINAHIQHLQERFQGILRASDEQAKGISDVQSAIGQLDQLSSDQQAMVQSSEGTVQVLQARANEVSALTEALKKAS